MTLDYDTVATFCQVASLLLFISLFIGIAVYVFWPGFRDRFESAQHQALDLDKPKSDGNTSLGQRAK